MWDYAKLSQLAKAMGGPEELIKTITKRGITIGTNRAKGKIGMAGIAGALIGSGITLLIQSLINKKDQPSSVEYNAAAQELINGINEYDKMVEDSAEKEPLPEITKAEAEKEITEFVDTLSDGIN